MMGHRAFNRTLGLITGTMALLGIKPTVAYACGEIDNAAGGGATDPCAPVAAVATNIGIPAAAAIAVAAAVAPTAMSLMRGAVQSTGFGAQAAAHTTSAPAEESRSTQPSAQPSTESPSGIQPATESITPGSMTASLASPARAQSAPSPPASDADSHDE